MKTSNPRHLPAEQRKALTVQAVIELAGRLNPSRITTAIIAEHMGLTQGALFRHFPDKSALWAAVMDWVADALFQRLDRATDGSDSPLQALEAMFMAHMAFVMEHPGVPRMLFGELQQQEDTPAKKIVRSLLARYRQRVAGYLQQARDRGDIAGDTDIDAAAVMFIGMLQGLVMQSMLSDDIQVLEKQAPSLFRLYRKGLGGQS